jgi:hypothetical protein
VNGNSTIEEVSIPKHQAEIIRRALYFDVFHYPLTPDELFQNLLVPIGREEFDQALENTVRQNLLSLKDGFILCPGTSHDSVLRRRKGNHEAGRIMPLAYRYSRKIATFPFVEGVYLSGALSKNYYDEKGDIDYFIVTAPNRLWICRTLLILRYKLLPGSKKKFWCVNYFISSDNLEIEDKNPFTGTELAYLLPTVNYSIYEGIIQSNAWFRNFLPNKTTAVADNCIETPRSLTKKITESFFSGRFGEWVDDLLLAVTLKHWQKKFPELNAMDFELQFRSRKNVCKRHNTGYQNKVLDAWEQKQLEFEREFKISLRD